MIKKEFSSLQHPRKAKLINQGRAGIHVPIIKRENRWKKMSFTIVLFLVLGSSIIGLTFSSVIFNIQPGDKSLKHNGREFFFTQNGIATVVNGEIVEFTYLPEELTDVEIGSAAARLSSARMAYATSDPNSSIASAISGTVFDIGAALDSSYGSFLDFAFTADNPHGKSVITCNDA